ncbi:MAG: DnaD domain protein [Clostridia bacterium]|nr:DnaD domain protein [Clostridia bacterium]
MTGTTHMSNLLAIQLIADNLVIPSLFLKFYHKLGIDDIQFLVILNLMAEKTNKSLDQQVEDLCQKMSTNKEMINKSLASLVERNFVNINGDLQLDRLLMALNGTWLQEVEKQVAMGEDEQFSSLYTTFEQEFGRLLTPMESEQIREWIEKDKYDYNMIKGALKRSVLRGVLNFKYVDSILLEWRRKNYKSMGEVLANEKGFAKQQGYQQGTPQGTQKKPKEKSKSGSKYKDIYMS